MDSPRNGSGKPSIEDRTKVSNKNNRKGSRDAKKVYALVLHQTAFSRGNDSTKYDNIPVHFVILPNGKIIQLHPITAHLWASNGFNPRSVAVEFVGNFPNTSGKCWQPQNYGCHHVSNAQVVAGRALVDYLIKEIGLTHILAHRQSSGQRENDPGPDIWFHVGQWAVQLRGLKDGGPGFKIGTGLAIPEVWRTWGVTHPLQSEFEYEDSEDEVRRRRGLGARRRLPRGRMRPRFPLWRPRPSFVPAGYPYPYPYPPAAEPSGPKPDASGVWGAASSPAADASPDTAPPESDGDTMGAPADGSSPSDQYFEGFAEFDFENFDGEFEVNRSSSEYAKWIQRSLNKIQGLRLAVDGIIGPITRSAIRTFQQSRGLTVDGIVGPITEGALIRAGADQPPQVSGTTPGTPPPSSGTPDIVSVEGINVARQISNSIQSLLNAARADGIRLSGGGYRSTQQQIELRKQHCGTSQYDIWQKPSSQCTPPTAPPGQSMHEKGLAIDFTYNGQGINSHDNSGFKWLDANASHFGLFNLPSEPWHWSVNGH